MHKIIPKFRGIKAYEEVMATDPSAAQPVQQCPQEVEAESRPKKRKTEAIDGESRAKSNEKRLKSLKQKLESEKRQQSVVREAIASGLRVNKRVVFNDSEDIDTKINDFLSGERLITKEPKEKKRKQLFESDSEDENNGNEDIGDKSKEFEIDFNKKIGDKNASKLIELNSRFAHDSRFKIDRRFLDQSSDDEDSEDVNESQRNLKILEDVLGKSLKSIKSRDKSSDKSLTNDLFVTRFDPKNEKSSEFEVDFNPKEKKTSKKVRFDEKVDEKEEKKEKEVSNEVYYEVSDSLKNSLTQKKEEFSLTQLFGTSSDEVSDKPSINELSVSGTSDKLETKKRIKGSANPFKYDSSSSEEESEESESEGPTQQMNAIKKQSNDSQPKPLVTGFRFFFDKNDSRFSEDVFWDKDLVEKARNQWKERQISIVRAMTVRKKTAKKNKMTDQKYFLKYKRNPKFKRFNKNKRFV